MTPVLALTLAAVAGALGGVLSFEYRPTRIALAMLIALAIGAETLVFSGDLPWGIAVLFGGVGAWTISDSTTGLIRLRMTIPLALATLVYGVIANGVTLTIMGVGLSVVLLAMHLIWRGVKVGGNGKGDLMAVLCIGAALGGLYAGAAYGLASLFAAIAFVLAAAFRTLPKDVWQVGMRFGPFLALGTAVAAALPLRAIGSALAAALPLHLPQ